MKTTVQKSTPEHRRFNTTAARVPSKKRGGSAQFSDRRLESVKQRKLSSLIHQGAALQRRRSKNVHTSDELAYVKGHNDGIDAYDTSETEDTIWGKANTAYTRDVVKGKSKVQLLDTRIDTLKDVDKKTAEQLKITQSRTGAEQNWGDYYESQVGDKIDDGSSDYDKMIGIKSKGYEEKKGPLHPRDKPEKDPDYKNYFKVDTGEIHADENWGEYDNSGGKIKNNKVLWMQYRAAIAKETGKGDLSEQTESLKKLQSISRHTIINRHTNRNIFMSFDNGKAEGSKTWTPGTDEFAAILQSPNALSSFWMLYEEADVLDKKIKDIKSDGDSQLQINFEDA